MNQIVFRDKVENLQNIKSTYPTVNLDKRRIYALRRKNAACYKCGLKVTDFQLEIAPKDKQATTPHVRFYNGDIELNLIFTTENISCTNCTTNMNKHIGSSLDSFLESEGLLEAVEAEALIAVEQWQSKVKIFALRYTYLTGGCYDETDENLDYFVGSNRLPDPDLSLFKTEQQIAKGSNGEFYDYEEKYNQELDKIREYLIKLGYTEVQFKELNI